MKYTEEELEILEKANIVFKDGRIVGIKVFFIKSFVLGWLLGWLGGWLVGFLA